MSRLVPPWWQRAVIYQVYIRSFADSNGDGIGDVNGIRSRLPYLRDLGVDAIWITPWYRSPMVDGGYDVVDHRAIDPVFGTLADAECLIRAAHQHGLRVIVDIVPNHTSDQHRWFRAAIGAGPGSPERERYWFRPGSGPNGEFPPNDWQSCFGGSAWERVMERDGRQGEWYLHLFSPEQPDLNWSNPDVRTEFTAILRFWLDRGIDGFRVDVAHALVKDERLPDLGYGPDWVFLDEGSLIDLDDLPDHPYWDRDDVHDIYREWREVANSYSGDRMFVAEVWLPESARLACYLCHDALHTAFNFDFLECGWDAAELCTVIDKTLVTHRAVGAPPTWVLGNHDVVRHITRYGRPEASGREAKRFHGRPVDLDLGTRRARAAALLLFSLPGSCYIYQGEELGLWEVEDIPTHRLQDPLWERSGRAVRGRDGCRVPIPWSGSRPPFGFSPVDGSAEPWLPQPEGWAALSVEAQDGDPGSMLSLYRDALRIRRDHPDLGGLSLAWDGEIGAVLSFWRGPGFRCSVNMSARAVPLPDGHRVLLASGPLDGNLLLPDTAVWTSSSR